jgi:hypothetical protein
MSAAQSATLSNSGTASLTITGVTVSAGYSVSGSTCTGTLAAGSSCMISGAFAPTVSGADNGTLTVTDNSQGVNGSTQTVSLTGTGVPQVSVSPASVDFRAQVVGTTSAPKTVTVTNNLSMGVTFGTIGFTGSDAADFNRTGGTCHSRLAALSHCTIRVAFTPAARGTRTATLSVNDSANNSPQTVALEGRGRE